MEQIMLREIRTVSILSFERTCNLHLIWYSLFKRKVLVKDNFLRLMANHKEVFEKNNLSNSSAHEIDFLEEIKVIEQIDKLLEVIQGQTKDTFSQKQIIQKLVDEAKTLKKYINNKISFTCKEIIKYEYRILKNYLAFLEEQEKFLKKIKAGLKSKKKNVSQIISFTDCFVLSYKEEVNFLRELHKKSLELRENSIANLKINNNLLKTRIKELNKNKVLFSKEKGLLHLDVKSNNVLHKYIGVYMNYLFEFYAYSGFIIINPYSKINDDFNKVFGEFKELILKYVKLISKNYRISKKVTDDLARIIMINRRLQEEFMFSK